MGGGGVRGDGAMQRINNVSRTEASAFHPRWSWSCPVCCKHVHLTFSHIHYLPPSPQRHYLKLGGTEKADKCSVVVNLIHRLNVAAFWLLITGKCWISVWDWVTCIFGILRAHKPVKANYLCAQHNNKASSSVIWIAPVVNLWVICFMCKYCLHCLLCFIAFKSQFCLMRTPSWIWIQTKYDFKYTCFSFPDSLCWIYCDIKAPHIAASIRREL